MRCFKETRNKNDVQSLAFFWDTLYINLFLIFVLLQFGPTFSRIDPQSKTLAADVLMQNQAARY